MGEHSQSISRRNFVGAGAALCATAAVTTCLPSQALAVPTSAEKRAEAAAVLESLNAMQEQLDIASAAYADALAEQEAAQAKMDEAQAAIDEAKAQIVVLQDHLGTRARSMYRSGSLTFLDLLLGATDFKSFTTNWDLLNDMNEDDAEMVQQTKDLKAEIEAQRAVYEEQERIAAEKAAEAAEVKAEAEAVVAEMQATYNALSAEAAELLAQEQAAREEAMRQEAIRNEESGNAGNSNSSTPPANVNNNKPQSVSGNAVVDRAYSQIGKPYKWAACGPDSFDCSGLVSYCLSGRFGYRLGSTTTFMGWTRVTEPRPGDVCTTSSHCGIYIGGGQMIHAPQTGYTVCVASVRSNMIYVRY
ncbi:MAG: C40 family peptidase [Eggerthellaceae bacterium]|nr:C40 family peptidase [Eggerthellaceae bacterium]